MGRVLRVINDEKLGWIRMQVEAFVKSSMDKYIKECMATCQNISLSHTHTKNFYDSVWGTIEINEGEIFILDSPVLQRLRNIKQLGLADLLYSSANHTRFSHTLGVLQTADVMAGQIQKELRKKQVVVDQDIRQIVRLSAIFHDCGHMFCSHASESYFQKNRKGTLYNSIKEIRSYFFNVLGISPSISEILSILIVNSTPIRDLLKIIQNGLENIQFDEYNQDSIIEKICCMIIGIPYSEKTIPFAKVISGQIDADKLDYLKRDSHSTGVPVAVDMSRVFQKLRVVKTDKSYNMIAQHEDTGNAIYKMAIAPAAINTVDQLVISRSMMFENIYYHQKTLTAEEMLRYAMLNMDESTEGILDDFSNILRLTDSIVVHNDFSKSITNEIKKINIVDYYKYKKACEILSNLYKRQLFKRCVAFTDRNLTRVIAKKKDFYFRVIAGGIVEEQEEFVNQVVKEIERLKCILTASKFHYNEKTDVLLLIAPDISVASIDSNISIDDKMHKDRDMEFEADNWLKSRAARKAQNYLVSYPEDRYLVYIASEVILLREYGVLINDMIIYTEEDEKYINRIKEYLYSNNYFSEIYMLAPESIINSYESDINELIGKWKSYEIFDVQMGTGLRLDKTYLILHIKQYIRFRKEIGEFDVFLNGYIKMLLQMRIVSKEDITKALNINFKRILDEESCEKSEIKVCNIGNMQDSSALIAYHMNIVNCCLGAKWNTQQLEEILKNSDSGQRIVFVEDAFCSGKQILSVFETYMGISIEERQTKETHVLELSEELKEKLRNCKLFFSFVFYEQENETFFYDRLKEIGLTNVKIIAKEAFPNGYFKTKCTDESQHERDIVKKYLERAGTELINWKSHDSEGNLKESWSIERQKHSILGYNDAQQLVAFSWNTPTYTMTPLWLGVDCNKLKWVPLFPRIDK